MGLKAWIRKQISKAFLPVDSERSWIPLFYGWNKFAWQADDPVTLGDALAHPTVYACVTQIASDIGKMNLRLIENKKGVWVESNSPSFSPVLRRPNQFQTRQKFIETWMLSKLQHGNTYVLKVRDNRNVVQAMYVLDPQKITPLVADDGSVFYRAQQDALSRVAEDGIIPASEIIHDTMECLFHPLVGVPPLYAASLAVTQGLNMQKNSAKFFGNNSQPGGVLTAPGHIKDETAKRIKEDWTTKYGGDNMGKLAVLGDGLKYEPMAVTAKDSTLVEQFKLSDEKICSTYKVPPYKIHVGAPPTYQQSETLDRKYYSDCLQRHIESIEALLNEGLALPDKFGAEFDVEDLLRMDFNLKMDTAVKGVGGGIMSPNEARQKFNLPAVKGGATPYLQQQNYSLAALDERDKDKPFSKPEPTAPKKKPSGEELADDDEGDAEAEKALGLLFRKSLDEEQNPDE